MDRVRPSLRDPLLVLGAGLLVVLLGWALLGVILQRDPNAVDLTARLKPPSTGYLLGTDALGRDIFVRVAAGARLSLVVGLTVVAIGFGAGVPIGALAGYAGGTVDRLLSGLVDLMLSLPYILVAIAIVAVLGPGLFNSTLAVGISYVPEFARVTRSQVIGLMSEPYVEAISALGASRSRVLLRHVLVNAIPPLLITATMRIPMAILITAGLSFIGLGAQPPLPEWGAMIAESRAYMRAAPHTILGPSLALVLAVLGFNLLGEGLNKLRL